MTLRHLPSRAGALRLLLIAAVAVLAACSPAGQTPEATEAPAVAEPTAAPPTQPPPTATPAPTATQAATATPPASPTPEPAPADSLESFIERLQTAVAGRDFATLAGLMADPFTIGYWRSEGVSLTPQEAVAQLEANLLPEGARISFLPPETDLAPLLGGMPPESLMGDRPVAATVLSAGWGQDGLGESILYVTEKPEGGYQWELLLFSPWAFGVAPTTETAVVITADEATLYGGPGTNYPPVATVFGGMPFPVTGMSEDGLWWRLTCTDEANEPIPACWVSADPAVSAPTQLP